MKRACAAPTARSQDEPLKLSVSKARKLCCAAVRVSLLLVATANDSMTDRTTDTDAGAS